MLTPELVQICKKKLIEAKQDILNRYKDAQKMLSQHSDDKGGDEGDQTMRILAEKEALLAQKRLREALLEIESALYRIEAGMYGVCEETDEPIESERLLVIPWTRLSIEGAETREAPNYQKRVD
ncbi:MAG: TraR/DksA family transcriptional regulator [Bdellovibrionota bacterium]